MAPWVARASKVRKLYMRKPDISIVNPPQTDKHHLKLRPHKCLPCLHDYKIYDYELQAKAFGIYLCPYKFQSIEIYLVLHSAHCI